ncbi:hypothetical protein BSL78_24577 [Apostichopus japonicus]|uniref:Ig-like domain-containing protein n=1 Tax=Stichopus japonicus TaxID=307972 RepID=A0A2G8JS36_STIJA|nr:hypothetical protein BSL78_24577 [Apostichopus japonicus]
MNDQLISTGFFTMGKFTVHLTLFLVVQLHTVVGEGVVKTNRNLELYQPGIIQCSLEEGFFGVQWFNSTEEGTSAFITYVRDVKDGPGFRSGDYDVWLNGSLFVRNVTVEHEGVFIVTHAPSASGEVKQYNIQVQLFVKPQLEYPVIEECQDRRKICYMLYKNPLELSCSVENVRPQIPLIWNQRNSQRDKILESNMTIIRNNEVTFTLRSTVNIHNNSPLLSVLVCSVNENTWILEENETLVILENGREDISNSPIQRYVQLHSTMTLPCNDFNKRILVWKRSTDRSETPEVILIKVQTWKEDFNETYNKDFRLTPDGSLMLPQTELYHQGIYTCVTSNYDMDHIQTINVVIFTYPSPQYIIVEGCDNTQYCVLDVAREGNLTCSVRGIRPEVELQWRTYGNYPDLSLTELERTSTEKGGIFDISLTTNFKILSAPERGITLECFIVGQNSDVFKSPIKAARIDLNVAYDGNMGISGSSKVAVVTTIIAALLILVVFHLSDSVNLPRSQRKIVEDEEMLPMTETHRTPDCFGKIVNYLQDNLKHEKFAMMCMLEQDYKNEKIVDTITKLASKVVHVMAMTVNYFRDQLYKFWNSQVQTGEVIFFHCNQDIFPQITIACLHLTMAFKECDGYTILLQSGLSLCPLVTVEKIHIETEKEGNEPRTISEIQLTNIFRFALRCQSIKELWFSECLLPLSPSQESIKSEMISRKIKIYWRDYGYSLDLHSGDWEVDNINIIESLCSKRLHIWNKDSNLQQNCTLQLLKNASNSGIPIFHLELLQSFSKANAGNIILCSGLQLSCPLSLKKLSIDTYEEGRELTETEVVGILMFAQQSQRLEKLMFLFCLLPQSIAAKDIPSTLKSRKVKVTWLPYDSGKMYDLNLESGHGW